MNTFSGQRPKTLKAQLSLNVSSIWSSRWTTGPEISKPEVLDWRAEVLEETLRDFGEKKEWSPKELFMTVRVAVTGRKASPPLFETMAVLGKETVRRRLRRTIETLKSLKS